MSSHGSVRISGLTWPEFAERVAQFPLVLLPVGALEQHGQHLPLDTDTLIAAGFADRVAAALGASVLPPLAYGARSLPRSGGGDSFPGTVNLDGPTLIALVRDIIREQARHGIRYVVALLGHGENDPFVIEGAELGRRDAVDAPAGVLVIGWWHVLTPDDVAPLFSDGFPGWDREHAARVETALMLAFAPEHVRIDRVGPVDPVIAPPYVVFPAPAESVPAQGSLADPRGATVAEGERLAELVTDRLVASIRDAFGVLAHRAVELETAVPGSALGS